MIIEEYSRYDVDNNLLDNYEDWNEESDIDTIIYTNSAPLTAIKNAGGVVFPNISTIITNLYNGEEIPIVELGDTSIWLEGSVGHDAWGETIETNLTLWGYTEVTPGETAEGGPLFSVTATWTKEANPASESDARRALRFLYQCFQEDWNNAYFAAIDEIGI